MRYFRDILTHIAQSYNIPVILIDDNSLLPVNIVSDHEEYGAYTLRKKYWNSVASLSREAHESNCSGVRYIESGNNLSEIVCSSWYSTIENQLVAQSAGEHNQFTG